MLKDTKSLGNNKAPACESRGFVLKKEGVLFDTPSLISPDRQSGWFLSRLILFQSQFIQTGFHFAVTTHVFAHIVG